MNENPKVVLKVGDYPKRGTAAREKIIEIVRFVIMCKCPELFDKPAKIPLEEHPSYYRIDP